MATNFQREPRGEVLLFLQRGREMWMFDQSHGPSAFPPE